MAAWPDILPDAESGYSRKRRAFQAMQVARDGSVQISAPHPLTQREYPLRWSFLTAVEREQLDAAFMSLRSTFFYLFDPMPRGVTSRNVGTGNGATNAFTLPMKEASGLVVRVNGVAQDSNSYVLSAGTGADGEDVITFKAGHTPANGHAVTIDATAARERVRVFIVNGEIEDGHSEADIYTAAVTFMEKIA